jgi:hypothetical protein
MDAAKAGFKKGLKAFWNAETVVALAADIFLAYADKVAAETAIRRIETFFIREGFAKGLAAAVMRWGEDEVATGAMNRVTNYRLRGMGDAAGRLTLTYMLKLAETYENYAVAIGYYWASHKSDPWKKDMLAKGMARLTQAGYDYRGAGDQDFFEYEFLATLAWGLRRQSDVIVGPAIRAGK